MTPQHSIDLIGLVQALMLFILYDLRSRLMRLESRAMRWPGKAIAGVAILVAVVFSCSLARAQYQPGGGIPVHNHTGPSDGGVLSNLNVLYSVKVSTYYGGPGVVITSTGIAGTSTLPENFFSSGTFTSVTTATIVLPAVDSQPYQVDLSIQLGTAAYNWTSNNVALCGVTTSSATNVITALYGSYTEFSGGNETGNASYDGTAGQHYYYGLTPLSNNAGSGLPPQSVLNFTFNGENYWRTSPPNPSYDIFYLGNTTQEVTTLSYMESGLINFYSTQNNLSYYYGAGRLMPTENSCSTCSTLTLNKLQISAYLFGVGDSYSYGVCNYVAEVATPLTNFLSGSYYIHYTTQ